MISILVSKVFEHRANNFLNWLQNHSVNYFSAHERPKRHLEPNQEASLDYVVGSRYSDEPADVSIKDPEQAKADPIR